MYVHPLECHPLEPYPDTCITYACETVEVRPVHSPWMHIVTMVAILQTVKGVFTSKSLYLQTLVPNCFHAVLRLSRRLELMSCRTLSGETLPETNPTPQHWMAATASRLEPST